MELCLLCHCYRVFHPRSDGSIDCCVCQFSWKLGVYSPRWQRTRNPVVSVVSQVTARRGSACRTCCQVTPPTSHVTRHTPTRCCTASCWSILTFRCWSRYHTEKAVLNAHATRCCVLSPRTVPHSVLSWQDLEYLCEGLEGRSSNPVAVLFDSLLLPDSDFGLDRTSPLVWRYEPERAIPHLVLGKGPPGGAWHVSSWTWCVIFPWISDPRWRQQLSILSVLQF